MSNDRFNAEQEALRALLDLTERADRCRQLYERANMAIPEPLRRFLGMSEEATKVTKIMPSVPGPERPVPPTAQPGWISIDVRDASPANVALAVLREHGAAMRAKDVAARVVSIQPTTSPGSVANIGSKLDGDSIQRSEDGWLLTNPAKAPVMFEGRLWGPPALFGKYELAAHRRDAVLHLLRAFPSGLQTSQIIETLSACPWVHAPINKELVQGDIEILGPAGEKKIRRRGPTKKWELSPDEKRG